MLVVKLVAGGDESPEKQAEGLAKVAYVSVANVDVKLVLLGAFVCSKRVLSVRLWCCRVARDLYQLSDLYRKRKFSLGRVCNFFG